MKNVIIGIRTTLKTKIEAEAAALRDRRPLSSWVEGLILDALAADPVHISQPSQPKKIKKAAPSQESTPPPAAETTLELTVQDPPQHKPNPAYRAYELYNIMARECGLPISRSCSPTRLKNLAARLKDLGGLDGWIIALNCVRNSGFIQSGKWTNFSIDSLLSLRTIEKLMDGAYAQERDDRTRKEKLHDKHDEAIRNALTKAFNT